MTTTQAICGECPFYRPRDIKNFITRCDLQVWEEIEVFTEMFWDGYPHATEAVSEFYGTTKLSSNDDTESDNDESQGNIDEEEDTEDDVANEDNEEGGEEGEEEDDEEGASNGSGSDTDAS